MLNPFKRKKTAPEETPNQNVWTERDWSRLTIIHHILAAEPDLTTVPGAYYQVSADTEYVSIEQSARQQLEQIEVSTDCAAIFDQAVKLKTLQVQNRLLSERLFHYREAVRLRTDAELHLHQMEERLDTLKTAYAALEEERRHLLET